MWNEIHCGDTWRIGEITLTGQNILTADFHYGHFKNTKLSQFKYTCKKENKSANHTLTHGQVGQSDSWEW